MKQLVSLVLILFFVISSQAQNQANNWFFGRNAGLNFTGGVPTPILAGALNTDEGCSSFSDEDGNLLFYTDGITVYDRNHRQMPNGNNLGGNPSSSQSGLIVPKPDDPDIFYLFTVGTNSVGSLPYPMNAGFKYYIVDMNLNGGDGDIVVGSEVDLSGAQSNQWTEKITSVQTDDCNEYWVISLVNNTFHSYLVDVSGVAAMPIISTVANFAGDVRGYLKVSPDGSKLVAANMNGGTYLYDFDNTSGIVSNGNQLDINFELGYGVEFSLDSNRLYVATGNFIMSTENLYQFDLEQPDFASINASRNLIHSYQNTRGALQLASNGKIYWASDGQFDGNTFLSVINNPENLGAAVNYEHRTVSLGGQQCSQGLPPFIQSLFIDSLEIVIADNGDILSRDLELCVGDTFRLEPDTSGFPAGATYVWSQTVSGVTNALPDMTSFLDIDYFSPYAAGEYRLEVDLNDGSCILVGEATVTYHPNPVINSPITLRQCDDDFDGVSTVNLSILYDEISANAANETFNFYETEAQAMADLGTDAIMNFMNYDTSTDTIWVSVRNSFGCTTVGRINIQITATNVIMQPQFYECDDFLDANGNDTINNDDRDGITSFDFSGVTNDVINLFPAIVRPTLSIAYYHNAQDGLLQQNEITDISNYRNIDSPNYEKIYIRVNTTQNLDCIGFGENLVVELFVEALPVANTVAIPRECDDDQDGAFAFDTSSIASTVLQGQTDVSLTYFNEDGTQIMGGSGNDLPNPFSTNSQTITIVATNNNSNDPDGPCTSSTTCQFTVDRLPFVADTPTFDPECEEEQYDDEQMYGFDTSLVNYFVLGGNNSQLDMEVRYYNQDGSQIFNENGLPSPLPDPFVTATQTITVQVVNPLNTTCPATTTIDFVVNPRPEFEVDNAILCLNNSPVTVNITDVPVTDTYTYAWYDALGNDITVDSNALFLDIDQAGNYSVVATTTDGNFCTREKQFTVVESNIATIENITVFDDLPNNQISVLVEGEGQYEFAIDGNGISFEAGNTTNGHIFNNVVEGLRTIIVRDVNGCGNITAQVPVIRFPRFITPNGDGINDYWQVIGTDAYPVARFTIFDRHGKVISEFTKDDLGWDGTYLNKYGHLTDYWYLATFFDTEGRRIERRGHFSLRL